MGTYQRARRWPEQLRAMQAWGKLLAAALADSSDGGARPAPSPKMATATVLAPRRKRKSAVPV